MQSEWGSGELAVGGEVVAEFGEGAVEAFFGGFGWEAGEAGDFGQGQVGGVAEEEDVAFGGGEAKEGGVEEGFGVGEGGVCGVWM